MFNVCKFWVRDESFKGDLNQVVLKERPNGTFYAKEVSPDVVENSIIGGSFMLDQNTTTIFTYDDINELKTNDIVLYDRHAWRVVNVQKSTKIKENQFNEKKTYEYYVSLKR